MAEPMKELRLICRMKMSLSLVNLILLIPKCPSALFIESDCRIWLCRKGMDMRLQRAETIHKAMRWVIFSTISSLLSSRRDGMSMFYTRDFAKKTVTLFGILLVFFSSM